MSKVEIQQLVWKEPMSWKCQSIRHGLLDQKQAVIAILAHSYLSKSKPPFLLGTLQLMESPAAFPKACRSQAELDAVGFCYFRKAEAPCSRWSPAKRGVCLYLH